MHTIRWLYAIIALSTVVMATPVATAADDQRSVTLEATFPDATPIATKEDVYLMRTFFVIELYAAQSPWSLDDTPLALRLNLQVDLEGDDLAEEMVEEVVEYGLLEEGNMSLALTRFLVRCLPPRLAPGDQLDFIWDPATGLSITHNGTTYGQARPQAGRYVMEVWLYPSGEHPELVNQRRADP